jgi:hypothetical protein
MLSPEEFQIQVRKLIPDFSFDPVGNDGEPTTFIFVPVSDISRFDFYPLIACRGQAKLLWQLFTVLVKINQIPSLEQEATYLYELCCCGGFEEPDPEKLRWYRSVFPSWAIPDASQHFTWWSMDSKQLHIFPSIVLDPSIEVLVESQEPDLREEAVVVWDKIKQMRKPKPVSHRVTILAAQGWWAPRDIQFLTCSTPPLYLTRLLGYYAAMCEQGLSKDVDTMDLYHYLFNRNPSSIEWFKNNFPDEEPQAIRWEAVPQEFGTPLTTALFTRPIPLFEKIDLIEK